jgi:DNA polymerase I-like protein with 3'-5' exonuclease and polymerase domains
VAGASTTKLALVRINKEIKGKNLQAKLVDVIHDEILVEVKNDAAEQMKTIVPPIMQKAFN